MEDTSSGPIGDVGPGPCPVVEPGPVGEPGAPERDSKGVENVFDDEKKGMDFPPLLDVRIVSDGKRVAVFDSEGRQFGMVESIEWSCNAHNQTPRCKITLLKVPVNIIARDTKVKYRAAYRLP